MLIRLFLAIGLMVLLAPATLGWFAASSTVAGLGVAMWLSRRPVFEQLFVKGENPAEAAHHAAALRAWTVSAALMLGILIGYLLAQLLPFQVQVHSLAQATMVA